MKALEQFVKQRNQFNGMFGKTPMTLKTAKGRQEVADLIDCCLSPENLTCDGELSRGQVNSRYKELTKVAKELQALDPKVKFYEFA